MPERLDWCAFIALVGVRKDGLEMLAHNIPMLIECLVEIAPRSKPHAFCQERTVIRCIRQHVGLGIIQILQAVLEAAQKDIGFRQRFDIGRGQLP